MLPVHLQSNYYLVEIYSEYRASDSDSNIVFNHLCLSHKSVEERSNQIKNVKPLEIEPKLGLTACNQTLHDDQIVQLSWPYGPAEL